MPDRFGSGKPNNSVVTDLHKGLTVKAPKFPDASMKLKGGSVSDDATRSSTAKTPRSLGPREA